eukprot:2148945-Pleurochrysis_carterae.AAC.1
MPTKIKSNAYSVLVQPIDDGNDAFVTSKTSIVSGDEFVVKMLSASGLVDCSFDFAVLSRSDCKLQSKINGVTGKPILETNFGYPTTVGRSAVAPLTFSSWNIPLAGPTAADAMSETLLSDDGVQPALVSVYFTNDYTAPHIVSYGFTSYHAGTTVIAGYNFTVFNNYSLSATATSIPWHAKHVGTNIKHPEDASVVLSTETGDITTHAPETDGHGLVYRFVVPVDGGE